MTRYTYEKQFEAVSAAICQFEGLIECADDEYIENTEPIVEVLRYILEKLRRKRDKIKSPSGTNKVKQGGK